LNIARQPRVVHRSRVLGIGAAAAAVLAAALLLLIRTPQPAPVAPPIAARETSGAEVASTPAPPPVKETQASPEVTRAKPTPDVSPVADQRFKSPPSIPADAPDFRVTDPAGYSHTLADYRGHQVVIAVWRTGQTESINAVERLYKANAANSKIRFLGVSYEKDARPRNTTFPIVYNQGSKMFGAQPGDFVVLDESGAVQMRGSLVRDYETLRKALQGK
jgi:hypothetical protein